MPGNSNPITGVLVVDKPAGPTSHDVVQTIRSVVHKHLVALDRGTNQRHHKVKVGHAGTLDPFATGLLLLGVGSTTRLLEYTHRWPKEYEAEITLGATSDTDDLTGTLSSTSVSAEPTPADIESVLPAFIGTITQQPPSYAAIKVSGKKLYEYARAGEKPTVTPRQITIHSIDVLSYAYPALHVRVRCDGGTYIRALARDIGTALATGAYCSALRRTQHGEQTIADATALDDITPDSISTLLQPSSVLTAQMTHLPLNDDQITAFRYGQDIQLENPIVETEFIALCNAAGEVIGTGRYNAVTRIVSAEKVLLSAPL